MQTVLVTTNSLPAATAAALAAARSGDFGGANIAAMPRRQRQPTPAASGTVSNDNTGGRVDMTALAQEIVAGAGKPVDSRPFKADVQVLRVEAVGDRPNVLKVVGRFHTSRAEYTAVFTVAGRAMVDVSDVLKRRGRAKLAFRANSFADGSRVLDCVGLARSTSELPARRRAA